MHELAHSLPLRSQFLLHTTDEYLLHSMPHIDPVADGIGEGTRRDDGDGLKGLEHEEILVPGDSVT